ncbi:MULTISPECIES: ATP-binding protein [unclassified Arcicella]|uniref:HAMP domain-containing sensor histidine kinase n=1 Tax=unclassified Arcicella TaxID=2644986 RepID=UPI002856AE60|nr:MULTISPECIES: ATP-binding protein [unclassified Arcicella]MDR6562333.1 signal transduction histidine kinase [Arcicella sp. BE51]MDR6812227.1 signal transduction histidine kinase [Arcicella sp. BE140]MDR6823558.1 signal transduction histidine kinase [Arcicella sp. BE139]
MKIKAKLQLGLFFLFSVIVLLGGMGTYYLNQLKADSSKILRDNIESLEYVQGMQVILNTWTAEQSKQKAFEQLLDKQAHNVTEIGEKEATQALRKEYTNFKKDTTANHLLKLNQALFKIAELNQQGIVRKNDLALKTAESASNYLKTVAIVCMLLTFTFIVNFPSYIANPIKELTKGIQEITNKNYEQRLHFSSEDEFGELASAFNSMAEKLNEYEHSNLAKILFEKSRIEAIINNLNDAVIGLDEKNRILFVNIVAIKMLNVQADDLIGNYAPDIALYNDLLRTLLNEKDGNKEIKIYADERESYFTKESLIVESNDKVLGKVILLKNITRFHELDEAKTNFIATISHELKTPISAIKMSLKLLENEKVGTLNSEQSQLLENIKSDSQRLLNITGELLDLTQVESGKISLTMQEVEPHKIIEYATSAVQFQAQQSNIELEVQLSGNLPKVQADAEKTAWILVNLLTNAIRYSPENSKIIVSAIRQNNMVIFTVQDFGKGIAMEYLEKIFDKYFQTPDSQKGTGLGLAIARQFIEAQNGHIWVESVVGEGSTFYFSLRV